MSELETHIDNISQAISDWLRPDNENLKNAINRSVEEKLFSFEDIRHQVLVLKSSLQKKHLKIWAERSGLRFNSLSGKKIMCLHAGNLPLVGIQDLLAVVLTGGEYVGKMSKKDPYLLPTLLQTLHSHNLIDENRWSRNLESFTEKKMDAVLFAGSESSSKEVKSVLKSNGLINDESPVLMRTAHFSIALLEDSKPETMENLTEAVFRYGGTGCRSVAIVVAPFHLNSEKCSFTDYVESFWLKNPQLRKPGGSLFYRYAYNRALKRPQAWLNDFLIEENISKPEEKFLLYWVKGGINTLSKLINNYRNGLQSVYSTAKHAGKEVEGFYIEPLSQAQSPPVWWKPDQIDTIQWLQKNVADQ